MTTPARALFLVAALAALGASTGCRLGLLGHRSDLDQRPAKRSVPGRETAEETRAQATLEPQEPYWPYRLGQLLLARDSVAQAENALHESLARNRAYAPALALLSKLYYDSGRHTQAIELLEVARSAPGGMPDALHAGLALHYDALGRGDLARGAIAGVGRAGDGSALVYVRLRGDAPDSAAAPASAALRQDGKSAANQNNYGITRLRAGDPTAARRAFQEAIELDPKLPGPYYNLAILEKFYLLDDAAAAKWFRLYRQRSGEDPDSLAQVFVTEPGRQLSERKESP
jgi:tetratricopeptide (TPR) repeat protein